MGGLVYFPEFRLETMDGFEERLSEVRKYVHLYDSSQRDYKDNKMASNSWTEIARNVGSTEAICRQKWKNLRDRFTKARKRMKSKSGDPGGKSVPPIFYSLSWLSKYVKHRDTETNFLESAENIDPLPVTQRERDVSISLATSPGANGNQSDCSFCTIDAQDLELLSCPPLTPSSEPNDIDRPSSRSSSSSSLLTTAMPSVPEVIGQQYESEKRYSKKRSSTPSHVEAAIVERLDDLKKLREGIQVNQMDEDSRFAETMADMLRKFPKRLKSEAKFQIHKILFEMEQKLHESSEGL